ncbi:MAG: 23S rRNA (guanosine(2251)-2'-O)-methyltransferase RlmB [Prevotellaceae bacterium]|jgi:23S rRNA (guanosine2251-2'-O)-methyltransferase|nr:23S rRNA (guanosine(2251)-2'-O)-methyltransferase RlmB [Prevotellaceae bacterium]
MEKKFYKPRPVTPENLLFGTRPVMEAIQAGKELDRVLVKKGLDGELSKELLTLLKESNVSYQQVPVEKLNKLTPKNHQGVVAFTSLIEYANLEEVVIGVIEEGKVPLLLLLDGITDVRNFGAIARSAECAGAHAIVVPIKGAAQINGDAMKTSAGALNIIPVCRVSGLRAAIYFLRDSGIQIVSATEKASDDLYQVDFSLPTAIVMGSEEIGISNDVVKLSDRLVKIPLCGDIASLNVSAAAAVTLFEAVRQRLV